MLWFKRNKPIEKDVMEFAQSRKLYMTTPTHVRHIATFIRVCGIEKYEDIQEIDLLSYINTIGSTIQRESERLNIAQALYLFLYFKKNEAMAILEKRKRGRPEKVERNQEILTCRKKGYTYDDIAKQFQLTKTTVYEIVQRHSGD